MPDPAPDLAGLHSSIPKIWAPAHPGNFTKAGAAPYRQTNEPVALVFHTPEEPADANEVTPRWFADPRAKASTHYYADNDGDLYQMVRERDCAWAQGVRSRQRGSLRPNAVLPRPAWWLAEKISYNCQALSIEIEGFAASIGRTFLVGGPQFRTVVAWAAFEARRHHIPVDRAHFVGHAELATDKSDPGPAFPWDALLTAVRATLGDPPPSRSPDYAAALNAHTADPAAHRHIHPVSPSPVDSGPPRTP